jgi:predicted transcriptional regulator
MASSSAEVVVDRDARIARIRAGVRERLARQAAASVKTVPPPRYDEVFADGMRWLDSLAGPPNRESEETRVTTDDGQREELHMPAENDKQRALKAIQALPDTATFEDAIERLCFISKIEEGLRQSHDGRIIPHDEVMKRS